MDPQRAVVVCRMGTLEYPVYGNAGERITNIFSIVISR